ncbi:PAS domain-containing protein [Falsiroseomonas sp. CW058]|uniref:PAS domain-containing protein n=1 Tax=Falsiroseomonas sp. CW058 TaxID=3388664 RepID=UPI003D315741
MARRRFRAMLAATFAAFALATGGAAALLTERSVTASVRTEAGADLAEAARVVADLLDRGMFERWRDIRVLAEQEALREGEVPAETRRALLGRMQAALPDYAIILFAGPDGVIQATSSGLIEGAAVSGRDWFVAGSRAPHVGDLHEAALLAGALARPGAEPPRFVDLSAPVRGADGRLLGVVAAHLSWEWAEEIERSVLVPLRLRMPGAEGFILSADGTVLLGPAGWRGRSLAQEAGFAAARAGQGWHGPGTPDPTGGEAARQAITGWAPTRGHRDYPGLGWTVAVRQDAAVAHARAAGLRDRILALGAAVAAVAALLGWLIAARLARPIEALAARATTTLRAASEVVAAARPGAMPAARPGSGLAPVTSEEAVLSDALSRLTADVAGMEERLAAREAEFRAMLAACPVGVVRADTGGRVHEANDAFLALLGLTREELAAGRIRWDELTPPGWLPRDEAAIAEAVALGRCEPYEKEFRRTDGSRVQALVAFSLFDRATGHAAGYVLDLTERARAEEALNQGLDRLRMAQAASGIGIHDYDIERNVIHWDARLREIWGVPEDVPVTYEVFAAGLHPDDLPEVEAAVAGALDPAGTGSYEAEFRVVNRRNGEVRRVAATGRVTFRAGRPVRLVGTARDVTAQRRDQVALAEGAARLRLALTAGGMGAWDWDPATGLVRWDGAMESLTGLPAPTGPGGVELFLRRVHPDDRAALDAAVGAAFAKGDGGVYEAEFRFRRGDGAWRWFGARGQVVAAAAGAPARLIGINWDITAQKEAAESLARGREELERAVEERTRALTEAAAELRAEMRRREEAQAALLQAQKLEALGQLTGSVAHDFNNVLAAISGSYRLIGRRTDDPKLLDFVAHGERAAARAAGLVRQLLAFARREELRPEVLDPGALLEGARDMLRHSLGAKVALAVEPEPGLWPVLADPHQLEVAVLNLAVNARDAMPAGGRLSITARNLRAGERPTRLRPGDYVSITVRDEGEGMSAEVLAQATEPFFTTKPKGRGTGLGLAMVKGFAEGSGGCLRIESRPQAGTVIEIVLPRAALTDLRAAGPAAPEDALAPSLHGGAQILLAEDDDQVRPLTAAFLRDLGYEVTVAPTAEAAMALAYDMPALDLLVTDIEMPGADGAALAARLRVGWPALPVLFVTGRPPGPALAGEAVLRKPVTGPDLARAVLEGLGRHPSRHPPSPAARLVARLREPALREAYLAWHAARMPGEALPRRIRFDPATLGLAANAVLAAVEGAPDAPAFRLLSVGTALEARFGAALPGGTFGHGDEEEEMLGTQASAYRRCVRTAAPVYQSARFDLGEGSATRFERLLLPLAEDGEAVTHVAGLVLFEEPPAGQADAEAGDGPRPRAAESRR